MCITKDCSDHIRYDVDIEFDRIKPDEIEKLNKISGYPNLMNQIEIIRLV